MASQGMTVEASRVTQGIISALSKHLSGLSIDQNFSHNGGEDIASLLRNFLQLSEKEGALKEKDEVLKWTKFANDFWTNAEARDASLKYLNEHLSQRAVLLGDGLKTSEADVLVFSAVHSFVSHLSSSDMQKVPHLIRWMDYIQNKEDFGGVFETIVVKKHQFEPHKKTPGDGKITEEKKRVKEKEPVEDTEISVTVLNIQVGLIRKAWKHPSADSLLVEEIDLGDGNIRQVVSGLAKYYSPDDLVNRRVVLITNVKPGKLRDVMSSGLVLCASNQDHTAVEPLLPPEGAVLGECISFSGHEGKPEDALNPKKKQLEKITPHLYTNDKGVATYKGVPFMTSAGPCTSSILNAGIK